MSGYDEKSFQFLEGLEAVRKRPGMYIGGTGKEGLHHLIWEIVDNAVDEAINGFASFIKVILHEDGKTVSVDDNGRGIPVGIVKKYKRSALELVFTKLHGGAKFDDSSYLTSGGLHGVGSSVVNALSTSLTATVRREGREHTIAFRRGVPRHAVQDNGPARGSGTRITFSPDPEIFGPFEFDADLIRERLETKAYLNKGLRLLFRDEAASRTHEFKHDGGLLDYLDHLVKKADKGVVQPEPFSFDRRDDLPRIEVAMTWTDSPREQLLSFVNGIPTRDGGTHELAFKGSVVGAVRSFIEVHSLEVRGVKLSADDIREGVVALVSVFIQEPQFQGQTKDKLNNPEVRAQVDALLQPAIEQWLHDHRAWGEAIVLRAVQSARARMASRAAAKQVRRKSATSHRLNLPGKLADCSSADPAACELFIVEGDSAGGSAKQGRDRQVQAVLPLRGKVLNTENATLATVVKNAELGDIVKALGCGIGADFDLSRLRYDRVILLMDADVDGHHIATLLLTFFYRHMPKLIAGGHVYLAQPPLYRIDAGKDTMWAADDVEKERILGRLPARYKPEISRFKGLGEMMPKTLYQTTLDPRRRRLLRVEIPDTAQLETDNVMSELMGKDPSARFRFIMNGADQVESLDV
ncbi:MAG: type IIA DNA topoisomerase subunit B [Proteobacteria bacterium]|nr:type IIA DNA topoisomerase subunit B [Pseudomonadota bacterium]MCP4915561.1 type IIA DNA topoisomerase subunit B [Pseudomonadota bacterium]